MKEIIKCIKDGLWEGYREYDKFRAPDSDFPSKITEYLFTVNIARELDKSFPRKGSCGIYTEYRYLQFIHLAKTKYVTLDRSKWIKSITRREINKYKRKSRIDIVIQGKDIGQQFAAEANNFAIELKGINPTPGKIKSDLERLKYALLVKNSEGANYVTQCYFAFLKRLDSNKSIYYEKGKEKKLIRYKKIIDSMLKTLFRKTDLEYNVEFFDFDSIDASAYEKSYHEDDLSEEDAKRKTGNLVGILVSIKKFDK